MNQRLYRLFVLVILALLLTPVILFGDQEQMLEARGVKRYAPCFEMKHRTMIQRCMNEVYQMRLTRCDNFSETELQQSCQSNVAQELVFEKTQNSKLLSFNLVPYRKLLLWTLVACVFIFLVKGPLLSKSPFYNRFVQQLPSSEFFQGLTMKSLIKGVFTLCFLIIFFLELAFLFKI